MTSCAARSAGASVVGRSAEGLDMVQLRVIRAPGRALLVISRTLGGVFLNESRDLGRVMAEQRRPEEEVFSAHGATILPRREGHSQSSQNGRASRKS